MDERGADEVIRLKVPCSHEYRDVATRLVEGACRLVRARRPSVPARQDQEREFDHRVVSAFGEAFSNVVRHGGTHGTDIEIEIEPHADHLTIRLIDRGKPFELASVPLPELASLPESGLGVYIMRSSMDDVSYAPGAAGAPNELSLTKRVASFSRTDDGDHTDLRIEGVLDALAAPGLRPVIDAIVEEGRRSVTVDLSSVHHIDSSGVGVIVSLYKRTRASGGVVRVAGVKGQPLSIFKLLGLDRIFELP